MISAARKNNVCQET